MPATRAVAVKNLASQFAATADSPLTVASGQLKPMALPAMNEQILFSNRLPDLSGETPAAVRPCTGVSQSTAGKAIHHPDRRFTA
jgi:hypothetical protein